MRGRGEEGQGLRALSRQDLRLSPAWGNVSHACRREAHCAAPALLPCRPGPPPPRMRGRRLLPSPSVCPPHLARTLLQQPLLMALMRGAQALSVRPRASFPAPSRPPPRSSACCSSSSSSSGSSSGRRRWPLAVAAAASRAAGADEGDPYGDSDDFYDILGVPPRASQAEIKRAYKLLMREFHPDLSGDEESTAFAMLLNEIVETLLDEDKRATYDALAGFSADAINPFADASMPRDQVFVDEATCIGCRNCVNVCPKSFAIEDDWGRARVMRQGADSQDKLQEAIDTCPVNCISWVSSPQLSLLEAAMARMERVAVWSLMSGGGGGRDVFTEASLAWEKRQSAVRAKLQQEEAASAWASWWSTVGGGSAGANMYAQASQAARRAAAAAAAAAAGGAGSSYTGEGEEEDEGAPGGGRRREEWGGAGTKEGARIAALAARAARASRQLKSWQELQARARQAAEGLLLTATSSASLSSQD